MCVATTTTTSTNILGTCGLLSPFSPTLLTRHIQLHASLLLGCDNVVVLWHRVFNVPL